MVMSLHFQHGDRSPSRDLDGPSDVVYRDKDHGALGGLTVVPGRAAAVDGDQEVNAAVSGVDDTGGQLDEIADPDGPVQMQVADVGGEAVATAPLCGGGVGGIVDPLE
jgi:hypothetical protein